MSETAAATLGIGAFLVALASHLTVVSVVAAYYRDKPILHVTLLDLLAADLVKFYCGTGTTAVIKEIWNLVSNGFGLDMPPWTLLLLAWMHQMSFQCMVVYFSYSVIVRYVYVCKRHILDDVGEDATLQRLFRYATLALNGTICAVVHWLRGRPRQYLTMTEAGAEGNHWNAFRVSAAIIVFSAVVNFGLRIAIWRQGFQTEKLSKAVLGKILGITVGCFFVGSTWHMIKMATRDREYVSSLIFTTAMGSVLPMCLFCSHEPRRKYLKRRLKNHLKGTILRVRKATLGPVRVHPA